MAVTMLAPNNTGLFSVLSGATYKPDQYGLITGVPIGTDIRDLIADGCIVLGLGVVGRNNMAAIVDPTVTNDASQDFAPGSVWVNTVLGKIFSCASNAAGAAIWVNAGGAAGIASGANATLNNLTLTGSLIQSFQSITAGVGGTQAVGVALIVGVNRIGVISNNGDSVKLPVSAPGMVVIVTNATPAYGVSIFVNTGESLNTGGPNGSVFLAATKTMIFFCGIAGQWMNLVSA